MKSLRTLEFPTGADGTLPHLGLAEMHDLIARKKTNDLRDAEMKKRTKLAKEANQAQSALMQAKKEKKAKWLKKQAEKKRRRRERAAAAAMKKKSAHRQKSEPKRKPMVNENQDGQSPIQSILKPVQRTGQPTNQTDDIQVDRWPMTTDPNAPNSHETPARNPGNKKNSANSIGRQHEKEDNETAVSERIL